MDGNDVQNQRQRLLNDTGEAAESIELQTQDEKVAEGLDNNNDDQAEPQDDNRYLNKFN